MDIFSRIGQIIASDRGKRMVSTLFLPEYLSEALALMEKPGRTAVVTGFFVQACCAPETDGPGGAVILGRALRKCGHDVTLFTDRLCLDVLRACSGAAGGPDVREASSAGDILSCRPDLVVFIERLGRADDGKYYNMRGEDVSKTAAPLDGAALEPKRARVLAVGDGGNEAGMGNFRVPLSELLPSYAPCLSVVGADAALPVDVSDWGGYALASLLSLGRPRWIGPGEQDLHLMLEAMVRAGAVDGVTRKGEPTVDGFPLGVHEQIVRSLKEAVTSPACLS